MPSKLQKQLVSDGRPSAFCGSADFRKDLHNFAFLGRSPRIGTASDWVWYNVPHGPQKQVDSFFQGQRCIREGREQVWVAGLVVRGSQTCHRMSGRMLEQ